jgi:hypothetical protein
MSQGLEHVFREFKRVTWANHKPSVSVFLNEQKETGVRTDDVLVDYRLMSYDEEAIADDLAQQLYLHTRH